MARPIAVVDTDVIRIFLDTAGDPSIQRRRDYVVLTFEQMERANAVYVVPAPVIAELGGGGPGPDALREISRLIGGLTIQVLDEAIARVAGEIAQHALRRRAGRERGAVKFDTLVFATAHHIRAQWLLTGNAADYQRCIDALTSPVDVVAATEPPPAQQVIVDVMRSTPQPLRTRPIPEDDDGA